MSRLKEISRYEANQCGLCWTVYDFVRHETMIESYSDSKDEAEQRAFCLNEGLLTTAARCSLIPSKKGLRILSAGYKDVSEQPVPTRLSLAFHNIVIHPLCGVLWLVGLKRLGDWVHSIGAIFGRG